MCAGKGTVCFTKTVKSNMKTWGAGMPQWLECHSWLKGHGFELPQLWWENFVVQDKLSVLTLILVSVPPLCYHSSTKNPGHSAKSAGGRLQLNTDAPYVCGFAWSDKVHGYMVYIECAKTAAVSCGTRHASAVTMPLRWIYKNAL